MAVADNRNFISTKMAKLLILFLMLADKNLLTRGSVSLLGLKGDQNDNQKV
jgi:hypothetical protein